jgi:hypothetical protein
MPEEEAKPQGLHQHATDMKVMPKLEFFRHPGSDSFPVFQH